MTTENTLSKRTVLKAQYTEILPSVKAVNDTLLEIGFSWNKIERFWKEIMDTQRRKQNQKK